jgi:hypothetical protein
MVTTGGPVPGESARSGFVQGAAGSLATECPHTWVRLSRTLGLTGPSQAPSRARAPCSPSIGRPSMTTTVSARPDSPAPGLYGSEQASTLARSKRRESLPRGGFNGAVAPRMKRLVLTVSLALVAITASGCTDSYSTRAAVGSGAGGALGAYVGSEVSGQTGAIIGGGLGAAAGSLLATETYPRPDKRRRKYHRRYDD